MRKQIGISFLVFLCLAIGCASMPGSKVDGKATPIITQSFASKEIRPGDTWKVYLKVSDPNGEMKKIFAMIDQPGVVPYPVSIIPVKKENRKELSGYIYLSTANPVFPMNGVNLTLAVQVQDGSSNFSQPVVFPLSINTTSSQEAPSQGGFKEEELGPVNVILHSGRTPR